MTLLVNNRNDETTFIYCIRSNQQPNKPLYRRKRLLIPVVAVVAVCAAAIVGIVSSRIEVNVIEYGWMVPRKDNEPDALPDPASQVKPPIAPKKSSKKRIIWLTFLAFITSLAGVVIGLRPWETVSSKEITTQLPETTTQFDNYGAIVSRENWGAKPSKSPLQPMNKAATLVVINHTGGKSCSTFLQCSQRVKDIQLEHFNVKNYRDISYNFLLGGDGRIYLGRGWRVTNEGRNESVDFAFIGNFNDLEPSNEILNMANWLISAGGWEDPNAINLSKYYVISNNLTEPSNSPGAHLYAKMNDFVFHTFKLCYANCSDGSYVQSKICPPEEAISC